MRVIGAVGGAISRLRGTDSVVTSTSVRLMHIQSALDHSKATREDQRADFAAGPEYGWTTRGNSLAPLKVRKAG